MNYDHYRQPYKDKRVECRCQIWETKSARSIGCSYCEDCNGKPLNQVGVRQNKVPSRTPTKRFVFLCALVKHPQMIEADKQRVYLQHDAGGVHSHSNPM
jgi:hypothetical protein